MRPHVLALLTLLSGVVAVPAPTPNATPFPRTPSPQDVSDFVESQLRKRQSLPDLLALASEAGIPLPTDPAALLALFPVATELVHFLPTAPILSVLETAVPSGFLSNVVHNPSYASGLEQAFATGGGPGWFSSLPADVRSYLHTYQAGALVSEVGSAETAVASALTATSIDLSSLPHSVIGQTSGTGGFGPLVSGTGTGASMTGSGTAAATGQTMSMTGGSSGVVASGTSTVMSAGTGASSSAGQASSGTSAGAMPASASSSAAGAAQETGMLAAGAVAAAGVVALVGMM